jgi:hypothetical protein
VFEREATDSGAISFLDRAYGSFDFWHMFFGSGDIETDAIEG